MELLVVIGIIALLISILLPALNKARQQANTAKCLSNIKQILTAAAMYTSENKGCVLPCGVYTPSVWWCNILVDGKYLTTPDSTGKGPQPGSVFWCPEGNLEVFPPDLTNNDSIPSARNEETTCMATRHTSAHTGIRIDLWYGMNASEGTSTTSGTPTRRIEVNKSGGYLRSNHIKFSAQMVMIFDGLIYHQESVNGNRISARHGNRKLTNLGYFDGHAESYPTESLPGGMKVLPGQASTVFSGANLKANFSGGKPMWKLEQQY